MNTKQIKISDYDYELSEDRIAKFPIPQRDHSKLLIYNKGNVSEDVFYNISHYLPKGSLMIFNNTKVIQARLHFKKETGANIEIFLLEPYSPSDYELMFQSTSHCSWVCIIGNLKKWKDSALKKDFYVRGEHVIMSAERIQNLNNSYLIDFKWDSNNVTFADFLENVGELPIPPYLNRETQESDKVTYQTVYSKIKGSVAAPTAGLHFSKGVLTDLDKCDIDREELTLHVGAGTFKPVKCEEIEGHEMHSEYICVNRRIIEKILEHDMSAIAVGTTSVRTLESLYYIGRKLRKNPNASEEQLHVNQWEPYETDNSLSTKEALEEILMYLDKNNLNTLHTSTQIIIAPGYKYRIVKMLITNFHQPKSTLLLLVSAFVNGDWRRIYDYALTHEFRFLSYGDSSLLIP
jgi:S-adenosylmethionine:tRNA ribosyltransferase-isomerase